MATTPLVMLASNAHLAPTAASQQFWAHAHLAPTLRRDTASVGNVPQVTPALLPHPRLQHVHPHNM
jgi:hypothetical protein